MTVSPPAGHRPLTPAAKFRLVATALVTMGVFYVFWVVALLLLLLLLAIEFVVFVAALRFGMAGVVAEVLKRHVPLVGIFIGSVWLSHGTDYRISLTRGDAPRLFALLDQLASRLGIATPDDVWVEMEMGAWVRLKGYRSGAGETILGLGYDLLAGLTESEVEAVLAHEMVHARLVQRGLKSALNSGVARASRLAGGLYAHGQRCQQQNQRKSHVTRALWWTADRLTSAAAKLVAAYSRQDEFEADRGAAELCGAAPLRGALQRLEAMADKLARLPWSERVAQLELEGSFSAWLVAELHTPINGAEEIVEHARDPYSTHPTLHDRLVALGDHPRAGPRRDAPAIRLLERPDHVARTLMQEIQRVLAREEQKDGKSLARWARKTQRTSNIRWQQLPGLLLFVGAFGFLMAAVVDEGTRWISGAIAIALAIAGVFAWRWGRYRDRRELPVPRFGAIKQVWEQELPPDLGEREKQLEAELKAALAPEKGRRRKLGKAIEASHAALDRCDYLRAHVAARLALDLNGKSVEAALALAVAAGGLGSGDQAGAMLNFVRQHTGFASKATCWGAAWSLVLLGDWNPAEAFLWQLRDKCPDEPTFLLFLALAQAQRNKLQSAVVNAQRAVAIAPQDREAQLLLAQILLDAGRLREAGEQLNAAGSEVDSNPEFLLLKVRWHLARRDFAGADAWADRLRQESVGADRLLRLAMAFETARRDAEATATYESMLATAYFPEAHLGLARLAAARRDKAVARQQLLAAINLEKTVGPRGRGPAALFHHVLGQMMMLEEPYERCMAWIVSTSTHGVHAAIANRSFMVYAPDQDAAARYFLGLLVAAQPSAVPAEKSFTTQLAPKGEQPVRPVRPGVQFVL